MRKGGISLIGYDRGFCDKPEDHRVVSGVALIFMLLGLGVPRAWMSDHDQVYLHGISQSTYSGV